MTNPNCPRCQYYKQSSYLTCAVHPELETRNDCSDFSENTEQASFVDQSFHLAIMATTGSGKSLLI